MIGHGGLGFEVWGLGLAMKISEDTRPGEADKSSRAQKTRACLRVSGSGFRVRGFGFRNFEVSVFGLRIWGLGFGV